MNVKEATKLEVAKSRCRFVSQCQDARLIKCAIHTAITKMANFLGKCRFISIGWAPSFTVLAHVMDSLRCSEHRDITTTNNSTLRWSWSIKLYKSDQQQPNMMSSELLSSSSSRGAANSNRLSRTLATLAALTSYTTTAQNLQPSPQPSPSLCSCSPIKFNFQLNFQGTCESTSLTGVSDELCFINVRPGGTESAAESGGGGDVDVENILSKMSVIDVRRKKKEDFWRRLVDTNNNEQFTNINSNHRALNSVIPTIVTSVDIFEYDTTNELTVINQQVFSNQTLSNGDIIEFTSISSKLDPNKPLQEQLEYFPGGLILRYTGVNSNNEDVINTFAWGYNIEDCTTEQISGGDFIGWMIVDDVTAANGAFCPATVTSPPTPTPTTLLAPTTAKPVNPTNSPTTSTTTQKPVTTTTTKSSKHPTPKPSKSGKVPSTSKSSKASHSPIHDDWSGSDGHHHHHHKPTTPSPVYNWKDKPTTSPIYDWAAGTETDPTTETFINDDVKPPSVLGGKSSKWYPTSEHHTSAKYEHADVDEESW